MKKLHLVCNSHIDPIWLWEWEEGAAAAVSTFRSAADLLDRFDYVFNHNEVTLYRWVKEYEPALFERIQKLAAEGKWHIMGGWFLQPDCNLPSGESFVRQMMRGREYFLENFESAPTAAMNVDPFGHSVGLVQILKKCGFDSYLFCRPYPDQLTLPDDRFLWRGPDGSEVKCFRASAGYLTLFGEAVQKIKEYIRKNESVETGLFLWGVGNHGGGPSARDLEEIEALQKESDVEIVHSTPEQYFAEFDADAIKDLPVRTDSLYPSMVGCYTSMALVKQKHRELENLLYSTEKLCSVAALTQAFDYPAEELKSAEFDLLTAEFHDVLPGTAIKTGGEIAGIRTLEHGLETVSRARAKAIFAITSGFPREQGETYPIFVFNPHPYALSEEIRCEFMLANQNWGNDFTFFEVYENGKKIPSQIIQEASNLNLDWRKNVLFHAELAPLSITRFECRAYRVPKKPTYPEVREDLLFSGEFYSLRIGAKSGLVESLESGGREYLAGEAFRALLIDDTPDPWGMSVKQLEKLGERIDRFLLMSPEESSGFCGIQSVVPAVRIVEDGDAATIVEASFGCRHSQMLVQYSLYKHSPYFDVSYKIVFAEKDKAVKIVLPAAFDGDLVNDTAYAFERVDADGKEHPMQKWLCLRGEKQSLAILNTGVYGFSGEGREMLPTLMRSAAYSAHPIEGRDLMRQDRYTDRMEQGERNFSFRILFGDTDELFPTLTARAVLFNEKPYAVNLYPSGLGKPLAPTLELGNPRLALSAFKARTSGDGYLFRIQNNSEQEEVCEIRSNAAKTCEIRSNESETGRTQKKSVTFRPFEVKTFVYDTLEECSQMEI